MTAIIVVLMVVGFVAIDILVRVVGRKLTERRSRQEREAALATSVRLDFTAEAPSLKRVEVAKPLARILAVDDEPVVLDSFRRILVLEGFNVDTVENGPEALGLVQRRDYDFVFTDLKMPGMDGVEVVKAVKHLRPDVDVAVITGYGTIETAVATMQHGAVDYVQKPFTPDELADFARKLVIRREARLDAQRLPSVRIVAPVTAETAARHEFCVPGGAFISPQHAWARVEPDGRVRVGLDDFARKALGAIDGVELPAKGGRVQRGDPVFTIRRGKSRARFASPVTGVVAQVNDTLPDDPSAMSVSPYDRGWICLVKPTDLAGDLSRLKIGKPVVEWYQAEIARLRGLEDQEWERLQREFFAPGVAESQPAAFASG